LKEKRSFQNSLEPEDASIFFKNSKEITRHSEKKEALCWGDLGMLGHLPGESRG